MKTICVYRKLQGPMIETCVQHPVDKRRDNVIHKKSHLPLITWQISKYTKRLDVPVELHLPTCAVESGIYFLLFSILNRSHHLSAAITTPVEKKSHFGNLAGEAVLSAKDSTAYSCRGGLSLYFYNDSGIKSSKNKKEFDLHIFR